MLHKEILKLLHRMVQTHRIIPNQGLYPPKVSLSETQTDEELLKQLKLFINYLERPYNSHIKKD